MSNSYLIRKPVNLLIPAPTWSALWWSMGCKCDILLRKWPELLTWRVCMSPRPHRMPATAALWTAQYSSLIFIVVFLSHESLFVCSISDAHTYAMNLYVHSRRSKICHLQKSWQRAPHISGTKPPKLVTINRLRLLGWVSNYLRIYLYHILIINVDLTGMNVYPSLSSTQPPR